MCNSHYGNLENVKTLLEMGLVSIDDKDAVSSIAVTHAFHPLAHPALAMSAHFNLTRQDDRTMLDYAKISKRNRNNYGNLNATIAFLQSCSCLSEFTVLVLTRSHHVQTSPSLPPLQLQPPLPLRLLRLPPSTLVLLLSSNSSKQPLTPSQL
jgi:hypothetical protein